MYYSLFDYIHFRLPKRFLVFGQSVFWVVRSGFAYVLGSVVGGLIIESVTTIVAFRLVGIVGIAFALFVLVFGEMNKQRTEIS
jgi:PPP family 3-phenylpropionic acid transporter